MSCCVQSVQAGVSLSTSLKDLRLSGNKLRDLPLELHIMSQLSVLHLKDNNFGATMHEVIETFSIPELLDFLKQLHETETTQVLSLQDRGLTDIPGIVKRCKDLKKLDFSKNQCKHISSFVGLLVHITDLNLRGNRLKDCPVEIGTMTKMKLFDLGENRLKMVPDCLASLHRMNLLWLDNNAISKIPTWVADLESLQYLNLDYNKVQTLEQNFGHLRSLRTLLLRSNDLLQFPESVCNITDLEELNLNDNKKLFVLPGAILQLRSLTTLQMDDCGLLRLHDSIGFCTSLRFLSVSGNNIAMIPPTFSSLMQLEILNVASNKIVFFPSCMPHDWSSTT